MAKQRGGARSLNDHYASNDYYCENERVIGVWWGRGAEQLGVAGRAIGEKDAAFSALFQERTPDGEKLKQRESEITGYDFQCSAQKSVSIMAMVGGDERLVAAHRLAVREAFAELESLAAMQTGQGVMKRVVTTGNVCCAVFEHDTSRALDPQLHTHCVLANVTIAGSGTRFALETRNMVKAIRYAGKVYQSALRREVTRCGYRTRDKKNERGQIEGFEIGGVGNGILSLYSQRRAEIETAIEAWRKEHGREPSPAEIHVLAKETRSAKLQEISTPEVRLRQKSRLSSEDLAELERIKAEAKGNPVVEEAVVVPRELIERAREHLAERSATFGEHQLLAEALNRGLGAVSLATLKAAARDDEELVTTDDREDPMRLLSTRANVLREQESVAFVNETRGSFQPINEEFDAFSDGELVGGKWLRREQESGPAMDVTEQKAAVEALLRSRDQVFALRGVAGAGKTTAIQEFDAGVRASGLGHFLLAPTRKAVEGLAAATGSLVRTVDNFLVALRNGRVNPQGAVITVDEWGLLSNRVGHELLEIAKRYGVRLRFVGDTRQHVGVEAGDFGRTLERHSELSTAGLGRINRQRDPRYNQAVSALARGETLEGIQALDELGWVHEGGAGYIRAAASRYLEELPSALPESSVTDPFLIGVGPTHSELRAFTEEVRSGLKASGRLRGKAITREVFQPDDTTRAQRRELATYRPGSVVVVASEAQPVAGLSAQQVYTVRGLINEKVELVSGSGENRLIDVKRTGARLEIGRMATIELLPGDRVLFRANAEGLVNGQLGVVAGQDEQGWLLTSEGHRVSPRYLRLSHGYATTSHTAQGVTAQHAVVFGAKFDAKGLYVSLSRAKVRTDLYTPDKEYLFDNAERLSGERQGALDALNAAGRLQKSRERKRQTLAAVAQNGAPERTGLQRNHSIDRTL
jgi:conjugative relaxase-like TrwC/TraI family protein